MEEDTIDNLNNLFGYDLEAFSKKPEEPVAGLFPSTSECSSLPASQMNKESSLPASSIPPGQKTPAEPARLVH